MITIYGIRNCDTIKKTLRWFDQQGLDYQFHDYKKSGIDAETLNNWCQQLDWELLVNRRGTTWRKLPEDQKQSINKKNAIVLLQEHTSMIKRPVVDTGTELLVGFDEKRLVELLVTE